MSGSPTTSGSTATWRSRRSGSAMCGRWRSAESRIARARAEARHAAVLRGHPHVVTVHDVLEHDGLPWIVMEYVAGAEDLRAWLARRGPLAPDECARVGLAVLDALTAGHERGIMHPDVAKPANILLARTARAPPARASSSPTTASRSSRTPRDPLDPYLRPGRHGGLSGTGAGAGRAADRGLRPVLAGLHSVLRCGGPQALRPRQPPGGARRGGLGGGAAVPAGRCAGADHRRAAGQGPRPADLRGTDGGGPGPDHPAQTHPPTPVDTGSQPAWAGLVTSDGPGGPAPPGRPPGRPVQGPRLRAARTRPRSPSRPGPGLARERGLAAPGSYVHGPASPRRRSARRTHPWRRQPVPRPRAPSTRPGLRSADPLPPQPGAGSVRPVSSGPPHPPRVPAGGVTSGHCLCR